jgi:hypothetical protein
MKYLLSALLLFVSIATCLDARAFDPADIDTLLNKYQDPDTSYVILGILTLDYTFNDLLEKDVTLHDVAVSMLFILSEIDRDANRKAKLEGLASGIKITKMTEKLESVRDEPMSSSVTWREASRGSYARGNFKPLQDKLVLLANAGIILPLTYLDEKHRPGETEDGVYFLTNWYLEHTDWSKQFGDLRYFDLMTKGICDEPCTDTISKATLDRANSVQAAIQLGILRTRNQYKTGGGVKTFAGLDCCKMPSRKCYGTPDLGCSTAANGYCTLGSYYCP